MSTVSYLPTDIAEFNPADLANLVRYCVQELMQRTPYSLGSISPFVGAGIYALFYDGELPEYQHEAIRSPDAKQPIYAGRARRTGASGERPLYGRLRDHAKSIIAAENLSIDEFRVRFLVLHPLWVSTVEDLLIGHYATLWNGVMHGFGVHDPGGKRHTGEIPLWDVMHPGRDHYRKMIGRGAFGRPRNDVIALISSYCATHSSESDRLDAAAVVRLLSEERAIYMSDQDDE